ncbi:hypothetical protein I2I11_00935 [Pontibacter sp. 172403-2]|uniref:hypothetical protein n=1 Tax=Pontibacter rufus TaxID=2791028 RepID=UPI0018AFD41B|nr:hypothetical protein [Pontibacter sp. 172403-2]MBF9251849.1 hypothetical protein [Pontibacter sp. 172403-2]
MAKGTGSGIRIVYGQFVLISSGKKYGKKEKGQHSKPTYQIGAGYSCQHTQHCFHSISVIGRKNAGSFYTLMIPFQGQWLQAMLKISKKSGRISGINRFR